MININELYNFLQFVSNKNQSGFLTPKDFNKCIESSVYQFITKRYHNTQTQSPDGRARMGFEQNQKITDDLRSLVKVKDAYPVRDGVITLPDDYLHLSTVSYVRTYFDKERSPISELVTMKVLRDGEVNSFTSSSIFGKKIKKEETGVLVFRNNYIEVYPKTLSSVKFVYLRKPQTPFWAFEVQNGKPVYDQGNSVDIELPKDCMNELVFMCCSYLGINLREGDLISYSENQKQQGV